MNSPSILPKALAGYLIDLYRIYAFKFRNPHSYTKYKALKQLRTNTSADTFIEAGTFKGLTAKRCAKIFKKVYTIELDEELYISSSEFLKNNPNVKTIKGDALVEVVNVLEQEDFERAVIFLDGHFSGGITAKGDLIEPSVEVLETLSKHRNKISGVIVDDFREFGTQGWPSKSSLIKAAEEHFESHGYELRVHLDQLILEKIN